MYYILVASMLKNSNKNFFKKDIFIPQVSFHLVPKSRDPKKELIRIIDMGIIELYFKDPRSYNYLCCKPFEYCLHKDFKYKDIRKVYSDYIESISDAVELANDKSYFLYRDNIGNEEKKLEDLLDTKLTLHSPDKSITYTIKKFKESEML